METRKQKTMKLPSKSRPGRNWWNPRWGTGARTTKYAKVEQRDIGVYGIGWPEPCEDGLLAIIHYLNDRPFALAKVPADRGRTHYMTIEMMGDLREAAHPYAVGKCRPRPFAAESR